APPRSSPAGPARSQRPTPRPAWFASRSRTPPCSRSSSATSMRPGWTSPSSRSARPAWTRSFSLSPATGPQAKTAATARQALTARPATTARATPPRSTTTRSENWRGAHGDRGYLALRRAGAALRRAGATAQPADRAAPHLHAALAERAEGQDQDGGPSRPEPAADHVPGAVHLRLRRRDRRRHPLLPAVFPARAARDDRGVRHPGHRPDAQPGHRRGSVRPVSDAADRPFGAAGR